MNPKMLVVLGLLLLLPAAVVRAAVTPVQTFTAPGAGDQDDMCLWVHPLDPALSTVIGSDKESGNLYVYALDGTVLQTIAVGKPGNTDVRYGIPLGVNCEDLVAFNERNSGSIQVYKVDRTTRLLVRVDDGQIATGPNYGFTLYRHSDGKLYGITGPEDASTPQRQYLLFDNGQGQVSGVATGWQFQEGTVEGMVGDDETRYIYLGEENRGIWRVHAMNHNDKTLIAQIGDASGLRGDVEGLTIYHAADGQGYLIASSQGADKFTILDRRPPHAPVGEFTVTGVGGTDGIDVLNLPLDSTFPHGIFLCHNGENPASMVGARPEDIAQDVTGFTLDTTSWDPREQGRFVRFNGTPQSPNLIHYTVGACGETGNIAWVLISCSGTSGFPLPGDGRIVPLTPDVCTRAGLALPVAFTAAIDATGLAHTPLVPFPAIGPGITLYFAAVTRPISIVTQ